MIPVRVRQLREEVLVRRPGERLAGVLQRRQRLEHLRGVRELVLLPPAADQLAVQQLEETAPDGEAGGVAHVGAELRIGRLGALRRQGGVAALPALRGVHSFPGRLRGLTGGEEPDEVLRDGVRIPRLAFPGEPPREDPGGGRAKVRVGDAIEAIGSPYAR
jgi:hypothetical protein